MVRPVRTILILALATCLLTACGEAGGSDGRTQVIAAFYPIAFAAGQIAGDDAEVTNLTPPGVEPHDVELSVGDVRRVQQADVVLYLGHGFQPALEDAVRAARGRTVDLLDELDVSGDDPHVWLDPSLYARLVRAVGVALGNEPAAEELAGRVDDLAAEYRDGLATCERRDIVTSHAAYGYLARSYALRQVPLAGLSPGAEASPQDLKRIAELVRESGATTVFVEPLAPPDEAETIARETGTETKTLNPLEGLTKDEAARGEDYFSLMRANLATLRTALGCRS
jgi:zinc transport system substrate-binding protein